MFFPKTALKALVLLSLLSGGQAAKKKKEKKKGNEPEPEQLEYMVYFGKTNEDVAAVNNIAIAQSSSVRVSSVHQDSQLAEVTSANKEDFDDFVTSLKNSNPDVIYAKVDTQYAYGWADKKNPMVRGRILAEESPYGIGMVQADQLEMNPNHRMKICVVDTGYEMGHEDLPTATDRVDGFSPYGSGELWDVDGHGHGSHCAGTIGAVGDNDKGVVGVNKNPDRFTFYIGKGLRNNGSGTSSGVLDAVTKCVDAGANVVSMSLGGGAANNVALNLYKDYYDRNVLFVAAAGNGGASANKSYPASYPHLMSVAAVDSSRVRASFSQVNDQVEIAAPGVAVKSTISDGEYASWSGTSMATPHVAGVAAKVWSWFPDCQNNQIRNVLLKTADRQGRDCTEQYGFGIVQAKAAYDLLSEQGCEAGGTATEEGSNSDLSIGGCSQTSIVEGPTSSPTSCEGKQVTVELTTDNYGDETSWELKDNTGTILGEGSGYSSITSYTEDVCVTDTNGGCLTFTILDAYGDGMCCAYGNGEYEVFWDGVSVASGASFTVSESTNFACNEPAPTAPEPTAPAPEPTAPAPEPTAPAPEPTAADDTDFPSSVAPTVSTEAPAPASDDESSNFPSSIVPTVTTEAPVPASDDETISPSSIPSGEPSAPPSDEPSAPPSDEPSAPPSDEPSAPPSDEPTATPTDEPTATPTDEPTATPTDEPTPDTGDLTTMSTFKHKVIIQAKGNTKYVGKLKVWLSDEDNNQMGGVTVSLKCTKDNGQSKVKSKVTNAKGIATISCFKVANSQSTTLSELDMTVDGYAYNSNDNSKEDGCPIFSDGCPQMVLSK